MKQIAFEKPFFKKPILKMKFFVSSVLLQKWVRSLSKARQSCLVSAPFLNSQPLILLQGNEMSTKVNPIEQKPVKKLVKFRFMAKFGSTDSVLKIDGFFNRLLLNMLNRFNTTSLGQTCSKMHYNNSYYPTIFLHWKVFVQSNPVNSYPDNSDFRLICLYLRPPG